MMELISRFSATETQKHGILISIGYPERSRSITFIHSKGEKINFAPLSASLCFLCG